MNQLRFMLSICAAVPYLEDLLIRCPLLLEADGEEQRSEDEEEGVPSRTLLRFLSSFSFFCRPEGGGGGEKALPPLPWIWPSWLLHNFIPQPPRPCRPVSVPSETVHVVLPLVVLVLALASKRVEMILVPSSLRTEVDCCFGYILLSLFVPVRCLLLTTRP